MKVGKHFFLEYMDSRFLVCLDISGWSCGVFFGGGSVYVNDSCYPCNNEVISCSPGNPKSHLMSSTAVQCVCVFVKLVDRLLFALLRVWNKYGLNSSFNSLATQLHDDKNLLFSVQDLYKVLKFEGHSNPKHVENFLQILIMTVKFLVVWEVVIASQQNKKMVCWT